MSPTSYQTAPPRVGGTTMVPMPRAGSKSDHDTKSRITTRTRDECLRIRLFGWRGGTDPDTKRGSMSKIELGRVGAALAPADHREFLAGVRQLEEIGVLDSRAHEGARRARTRRGPPVWRAPDQVLRSSGGRI